jgi:NAD(P)H-hydrate epimerase
VNLGRETRGLREIPVRSADAVPWISVAQMREVDRTAVEIGLSLTRMMENAGAALAGLALALLGGDVRGRRIGVLAGPGGNGGGGLVAARRLLGWGAEVEVRLSDRPEALAAVPGEQLAILDATGARIEVGADRLAASDLLLDAILGYGQRGEPREAAAELIAATEGTRVLSLDVPSGLALEQGAIFSPAIRGEATLTLALPKAALRIDRAEPLIGELYLADIGIPPSIYERLEIAYRSPFDQGPVVRLT